MRLLILCNDRMALPALGQLLSSGLVVGVGMTVRETEVKYAVKSMTAQNNVPLRFFEKKNFTSDLSEWLQEVSPDAVLVKTFPWKIPAELLAIPRFGFINFHYAPLPEWSGSNPLFWMIRNRASEAGVTVHQMTAEIDKGPIIHQQKFPLAPGTTFGMLTSQLAYTGTEITGQLLQMLMQGEVRTTPQQLDSVGWYDRPTPKDLIIDWTKMTASEVASLVDACNPWNKGGVSMVNGWMLGVTHATPIGNYASEYATPGTIVSIDEKDGLMVVCKDSTVVRADIVYAEEGFMPGWALSRFGIKKGMQFHMSYQ